MVNLKVNYLPDKHIVDRYFAAVKNLGVNNDGLGLAYYIPDEDRLEKKDLPPSHAGGFIAFVVGGMHYTKMLPDDKIMQLCNKIDKPVILMGGKDDMPKGERITLQCDRKVFNACGLYNINQSASIISMADMVISNDTGLMHIAAAFKKEIYSIWGNTIPEFGMYPYMPGNENKSHIIEVKNLSCRPCSKLGYSNCPKKHFRCMMDINISKLASDINR
jgi:heptosyltransferase-2